MPLGVRRASSASGGAGLARGYLARPALTAERFVPDPVRAGAREPASTAPATWPAGSPDGELEFLGRLDHQVKVRGFRIELGEVEAAPGGRTRRSPRRWWWRGPDAAGDARLVAYVVPGRRRGRRPSELRRGLRERLPGYMVPAVLVVLDALP